jgi:amino acid transporter
MGVLYSGVNVILIFVAYVIGCMSGWMAFKARQWWHRVRAGWRLVEPFAKHAAISVGLLFVLALIGLKYTGAI